MVGGIEHRKFTRRRYAAFVKFTVESKLDSRVWHGITGNICDMGFSLYTVSNLEKDDVLKLTLQKPECLGGKVRWAKRINGIFQAGVECSKLIAL